MVNKKIRSLVRAEKHRRIRHTLSGTPERPRLSVFRSNKHIYAQIIDDVAQNTLVSASTLDKDVKSSLEKTNNIEAAKKLGSVIAEKAKAKGISAVVLDRGGLIYAGKIQAFSDAAREGGLQF